MVSKPGHSSTRLILSPVQSSCEQSGSWPLFLSLLLLLVFLATICQLKDHNGYDAEEEEEESEGYESETKIVPDSGVPGWIKTAKAETSQIENEQDNGCDNIEKVVEFAFERLQFEKVEKENESSDNHKAHLDQPKDREREHCEYEDIAVKKEERVEETSRVLLRSVSVLIHFSVLVLVSWIWESVTRRS